MMVTDPFRMMVPPPFAVAPHVRVVPVAVIAPIGMMPHPLGMMLHYPFGMI